MNIVAHCIYIYMYTLKSIFNVKQTINLVPLQLQGSSIKQIYRLMYFFLCLQVMKQVHGILGEALCGQMTSSLLQSYKTDEEGFAFYDDFLGNGDMSSLNKTIVCKENNLDSLGSMYLHISANEFLQLADVFKWKRRNFLSKTTMV